MEAYEGQGHELTKIKNDGAINPLPLQVGGVSYEIVKYGREFCGTWTRE
jgi:hypothetical protein